MEPRDPHEVLGVSAGASRDEIMIAYRAKSLELRGRPLEDVEAAARLVELSRAYGALLSKSPPPRDTKRPIGVTLAVIVAASAMTAVFAPHAVHGSLLLVVFLCSIVIVLLVLPKRSQEPGQPTQVSPEMAATFERLFARAFADQRRAPRIDPPASGPYLAEPIFLKTHDRHQVLFQGGAALPASIDLVLAAPEGSRTLSLTLVCNGQEAIFEAVALRPLRAENAIATHFTMSERGALTLVAIDERTSQDLRVYADPIEAPVAVAGYRS